MAGEVGHKGSKMFLGIGQSNWVAMLTINYRPDWKARKEKKKKRMVGVLSSWETWKGRHVRNRKINSDDSLTFFCSNMHVLRGLDVVSPVHNLKCPYAVMPFTGLIPTPSSSSANGRLPHGRLTSRSVEKNLKSAS